MWDDELELADSAWTDDFGVGGSKRGDRPYAGWDDYESIGDDSGDYAGWDDYGIDWDDYDEALAEQEVGAAREGWSEILGRRLKGGRDVG